MVEPEEDHFVVEKSRRGSEEKEDVANAAENFEDGAQMLEMLKKSLLQKKLRIRKMNLVSVQWVASKEVQGIAGWC